MLNSVESPSYKTNLLQRLAQHNAVVPCYKYSTFSYQAFRYELVFQFCLFWEQTATSSPNFVQQTACFRQLCFPDDRNWTFKCYSLMLYPWNSYIALEWNTFFQKIVKRWYDLFINGGQKFRNRKQHEKNWSSWQACFPNCSKKSLPERKLQTKDFEDYYTL